MKCCDKQIGRSPIHRLLQMWMELGCSLGSTDFDMFSPTYTWLHWLCCEQEICYQTVFHCPNGSDSQRDVQRTRAAEVNSESAQNFIAQLNTNALESCRKYAHFLDSQWTNMKWMLTIFTCCPFFRTKRLPVHVYKLEILNLIECGVAKCRKLD